MKNGSQLPLERCPHCSVAKPSLNYQHNIQTNSFGGGNSRTWWVFACTTCGGVVMTVAPQIGNINGEITEMWPAQQSVANVVPERARKFLSQAMDSLHAPVGAVMLTASSVDAMLKDKGYKEGSLNSRIDKAASDHLITAEMAAWAHEIRLDANDQRHSDEAAALPDEADAKKVIDFANALAQFLYVLPARVERGRKP
jgi:Domain of unknown function (DUF4145)